MTTSTGRMKHYLTTIAKSTVPAAGLQSKPLIVLLGWLGCKQRTLNRYIELYNSLGCQVITRILPPVMVIHSVHSPLSPLPRDIHRLLMPSVAITARQQVPHREPTNITDFAVDILQEIIALEYPTFIIHNFSNGGCFLWEKIHQILQCQSHFVEDEETPKDDREDPVSSLRDQFIGVVFDSSPAAFHTRLNLLDNAIMHIPRYERLQLKLQMLTQQWTQGKTKSMTVTQQRSIDFWNTMMHDEGEIPQLYIYSTIDHLTDYKELENLILYRKSHYGNHVIQSLRFEDSHHCSHLLRHPIQYMEATRSFIESCLYRVSEKQQKDKVIPLFSKL